MSRSTSAPGLDLQLSNDADVCAAHDQLVAATGGHLKRRFTWLVTKLSIVCVGSHLQATCFFIPYLGGQRPQPRCAQHNPQSRSPRRTRSHSVCVHPILAVITSMAADCEACLP